MKQTNNIQTPKDLGRLVRAYRKEQGLTQEELALLANVGTRFIIDLEKGKKTVQLGKVIEVLLALGVGLALIALWSQKDE